MKNIVKILAVAAVSFSVYAFTAAETKETITVVIDAGHGGTDFGAVHESHMEKDIVSQISNKIHTLNKNSDVIIYFTRTDDNLITLEKRTAMINDIKPDLFVSLHVNQHKNDGTFGMEGYVAKESLYSEESLAFASDLTSKLSKATNLNVRGIKKAPFYILKNTNCPGLVLELGFLSNEKDRNYLTDANNQEVIAKTILDFICQMR